ncbi:MAG: transposase, partial [Clostridia bacterium]|nr:transposase [Clostridia bacterium]
SGIYHVMFRGINQQDLFEDDQDRQKFIKTLAIYKEKSGCKIYAYCLMSNHVHLLMKEVQEDISQIIKRISSSYVYYYNRKYCRYGHLFQERFKSETVEDDSYFLTVLRYIHQNPRKANMIKKLEEYKWSSYNEYLNAGKIVDVDLALEIFSEDKMVAIPRFIVFSNEKNEDKCLEYEVSKKINDTEARKLIKSITGVKRVSEIQGFEKEKRDEIVKKIKGIKGVSIRQIARITGVNYSLALKA